MLLKQLWKEGGSMEKQPFHLKYRPKTFDEFIGNNAIVNSIIDTIPTTHTYLFYGPKGCGKTTLARLVAKELEIENPFDIHEIDAASIGGIDATKEIKSTIYTLPLSGNKKIYIIDECHRLTVQAQDVWLKTFEEPPAHVYFVLCTTDFQKVLSTIKSRAARYQVRPLKRKEMTELIDWVCKEEKIELDKKIKKEIINNESTPRDALVLLDQIKECNSEEASVLMTGIDAEVSKTVIDLCRLLLKNKKNKWKEVVVILKDLDEEAESIRRAVLGYMAKVMLDSEDPVMSSIIIEEFEEPFYNSGKAGLVLACYRIVFG